MKRLRRLQKQTNCLFTAVLILIVIGLGSAPLFQPDDTASSKTFPLAFLTSTIADVSVINAVPSAGNEGHLLKYRFESVKSFVGSGISVVPPANSAITDAAVSRQAASPRRLLALKQQFQI